MPPSKVSALCDFDWRYQEFHSGESYQSYQPVSVSSGTPPLNSTKPFWSPWL